MVNVIKMNCHFKEKFHKCKFLVFENVLLRKSPMAVDELNFSIINLYTTN